MEFTGFQKLETYTKEHFQIMKNCEQRLRPYHMKSPQLQFRKELIDWLKLIAENTNINFLTFYQGVTMMDSFMDNHDVRPYRLRSIAACCLMLSAKMEQSGCRLPTYARIFSLQTLEHDDLPDPGIIQAIERKLVEFFDFRLMIPSVAHFLYHLLPDAIQTSDISPLIRGTSAERTLQLEMRDLLQTTLETILYDTEALKQTPSGLACASVIHARVKLHLPSWPESLIELTGYWPVHLSSALEVIFKYGYAREMEEQQMEQSPQDDSNSLQNGLDSPQYGLNSPQNDLDSPQNNLESPQDDSGYGSLIAYASEEEL